jgi:hypothetical protein
MAKAGLAYTFVEGYCRHMIGKLLAKRRVKKGSIFRRELPKLH